MKRVLAIVLLTVSGVLSLSAIAPYLLIGKLSGSIQDASKKTIEVLEADGYEVIGQYRPGSNPDLYVVVFTSSELKTLCKKSKNRGMLAAAMKVGFQNTGGSVSVSLLNPEYLFYAYFREKMEESAFKSFALSLSSEIKNSMKKVGSMMTPFGGDLSTKDLIKYHYMVGMPYFDDPVKLVEFDSFDQGLSIIQKRLSNDTGKTIKVYEILDKESKTAVFGVGLPDAEEGEAHFLPIIGESHVAAMPYEIILQQNRATMLHGRYRFALHWPELSMKTFTKIMSSPGDVEDAMKTLVE
ncbi:MAG: hypothetical protein ABFS28_15490 [Bacteroidota bacterium]